MNNMRRGGSRAYKHSIIIYNVGSLLCLSKTLELYHLLSFYSAREGESIWPKRKKPEYTNKGTGLLQAQLKLVYYTAPFEINVGGSGRAKRSGFSLLAFFCLSSLLSDILGNIGYRKYCDLQV